MLNKLLEMIRRYEMISSGDRIICAVSGGADSVALLFAMYLLRKKLEITLEAAHFNHRLRGSESDGDEAFVVSLCDRLEIPLHLGSEAVMPGEKGLEAAARDARYRFFATLSGKIATAHTADDNAETVLMHLVRGTGLKGLGAISPIRGNLIRPMLLVTRQQVLDFCQEYCLQYVCDSSNETDAFMRNRLRHHVMPLLKQENPKLSRNLSEMALRLRQDEEALTPKMDYQNGLPVSGVLEMPAAIRNRVLSEFLKYHGVKEPDSAHIAQADALLRSENPSAWTVFPGNVTICRQYDRLVRSAHQVPLRPIALPCPGEIYIPELDLHVKCTMADEIINDPNTFTVAQLSNPVLRSRETGDTMRCRGGSKSLKKLYIDLKIPADSRPLVPVIADDAGVLGVCGIGPNLDRIACDIPAVQIRFCRRSPEK